jgi:hypothetical protein
MTRWQLVLSKVLGSEKDDLVIILKNYFALNCLKSNSKTQI